MENIHRLLQDAYIGFDFIAITDHHKYKPSVEGKECFEKLTNFFIVFCGVEVHNRDKVEKEIMEFKKLFLAF